jgi:hypothetical protein
MDLQKHTRNTILFKENNTSEEGPLIVRKKIVYQFFVIGRVCQDVEVRKLIGLVLCLKFLKTLFWSSPRWSEVKLGFVQHEVHQGFTLTGLEQLHEVLSYRGKNLFVWIPFLRVIEKVLQVREDLFPKFHSESRVDPPWVLLSRGGLLRRLVRASSSTIRWDCLRSIPS